MAEVSDIQTRIQEAARIIIARYGVNNATIQAIVEEASTSKGALYHYYRSKNEVLYDVMDASLKESTRVAQKMHAGARPDEVLHYITSGLDERFDKVDENRLQFYLAHEAMLGNKELKSKFARKYDEWIGRVEEMLLGIYGVPETSLNRAIAAAAIATVDGMVMQDLLGVGIISKEEALKVWEIILYKVLPFILEDIHKQELMDGKTKDR